ncbi:RICIN domain-containing protein [Crossiella sp. SN42]|uniref:RICIN domain-containing protein n=1 Tax=Crossiella sp. SN42 TaxID=2944808 RepID=UPI00207C6F59|nr:RICIN domain-containing protein [Crossiella sp. SN42]MCO1579828.1 RICIN domain-containing protein [Crossiella sp. SN42]
MATAATAAVVAASSLTLVSAPAAGAAVTPGAWYKVVIKASGKCVDARGAAAVNGTAVQQYTCNDTTAQQWQFQESGGGFFRLNSRVDAAQVIDVAESSTADGGLTHLWTYGGGANQQWQPVQQADGSHRLVNRNSGKCLDLTEGSQADSVQFQQWTCFEGSPNQSFTLVLAGGDPGPGDPDFGPNVFVFDPSTPRSTIQNRANTIFQRQERAQFGPDRYAMLFKPGTYDVDVNVGYYTQVLGLGRHPDEVNIRGAVHVEADWFQGNATHNFWRAAENLSVTPNGGMDRWAVSQAAPYRRMHVRGDLQLDDNGWSSGGFMADSKIDGQVRSGSQQQWLSRNTNWGSWNGSNWNMVFVGADNAPAGTFPNPPYTRIDHTPRIREKPFLQVNAVGAYEVFVPALRENSRGTTWESGNQPGQALPISSFFIAKPGTSAAAMNQALAEGKNLIVTPGIYRLEETLRVTRPDTVVLGMGLATLMPNNGITALTVADVPGVKIAGLLIDAGTTNSTLLMEVGPQGSAGNHAANPTSLHDLFIRIGGMVAGKATTSLVINSRNVIGDHLWLWRGDHGDGIGWHTNTADVGLVVNGDNVSMYGLFVEHYQKYQTIWNGQGGKTFFYQNEMPYDPPDQAAWMNGSTRGYAAYKVGDHVTSHEAHGLGSYCFFNVNRGVVAERAFEVPNHPNVRFRHMVTVSLGGGAGTINRVINNSGGTAGPGQVVQNLVSYP